MYLLTYLPTITHSLPPTLPVQQKFPPKFDFFLTHLQLIAINYALKYFSAPWGCTCTHCTPRLRQCDVGRSTNTTR